MSWGQYFLAVFVAGVVCALSDWFFTMVLFPNKYHTYPEVWRRPEDGKGELQRFLLSSLLGFVTCAAFILLSIRLELLDLGSALKLAGAIWFIVPLPLLFTNALWVKIHPPIVVAHAIGWLSKLVLTAVVVGWLLS